MEDKYWKTGKADQMYKEEKKRRADINMEEERVRPGYI